MPEPTTVTAPTEQAPVTEPQLTSAAPQPTPQDEARRALYEKHYGGPPPADVVEPATPAEPAQGTASPEPTAPAGNVVPPEVFAQAVETLRAMQHEIAGLKAQVGRPTQAPPPPVAADEPGWVKYLRDGNIAAAEDALAAAIAAKQSPQLIAEAVERTRQTVRLEAQAESFVNELKAANPELVPLEGMIAADASQRLSAITAAGTIRTPEDAIREYKRAVLDATESARKVVQSIRGSGKAEAMVRNREILSSTTLPPQSISSTVQGTPSNNEPQPQSTEAYFEARRQRENANRGLAV